MLLRHLLLFKRQQRAFLVICYTMSVSYAFDTCLLLPLQINLYFLSDIKALHIFVHR